MKLLRVLGAAVVIVAVAGAGYVAFEIPHGPPADFVDKPVVITSTCKASDVQISASAGDQVAWTVQGSDVDLAFPKSPFVSGTPIHVAVGPTATSSGPLTKTAKVCAILANIFGSTCDYPYAIERNHANCDPKVIVSR
jgi:hypothetical protein